MLCILRGGGVSELRAGLWRVLIEVTYAPEPSGPRYWRGLDPAMTNLTLRL